MTRVLIVDDDRDLLEVVSLMVESHEMETMCLTDGNKVWSALLNQSFDLVLMDIYLGSDDGREIARALKQDERFQNIPILLYSAGAVSAESIGHSLANDFIAKPFDMHSLLNRIEKLLPN